MHMSDALLSPAVGLAAGAAAAALVGHSARRAAREPQHTRRIPLMGVMAAFVFAAQMVNFSIPGTGSSGHIAGGLLLALLLGPYAAFIAMASVLTVQCLLFADGGLLALGCNLINLAFWPCFVGLPLCRAISGGAPSPRRRTVAAIVASVLSLQLGALGVVIESVLSGRSEIPFVHFGAVMLGIHLPIGLVEGVVTAGALRVLGRAGTGTGDAWPAGRRPGAPVLAGVALATLLAGGVLAWFASAKPDGLEWSLARITGPAERPAPRGELAAGAAAVQQRTALAPDYQIPASAPRLGLSAAGLGGAVAVGLLCCAMGFAATSGRLDHRKSASPP